jgi:hypothetical protein
VQKVGEIEENKIYSLRAKLYVILIFLIVKASQVDQNYRENYKD